MKKFKIRELKNQDLLWVGIDFDLVICQTTKEHEPTIPMEGAKEALEELQRAGYKIIVYTARAWAKYILVEDWLNHYKIPFDRIICGKPLFKYIIDDRNIEFRNWRQAMEDIKWKEIGSHLK